MDRKRSFLLPVSLALAAVVAGVVLLFMADDNSRSDRSSAARRTGDGTATGVGVDPDGRGSDSSGAPVADAARTRELIRTRGGFRGRGRVLLTNPAEAGAKLEVTLQATIDGSLVESRVATAPDGAFAFPELPRSPDYLLSVEGERVKPLRREVVAEQAEEDFGELILDRYYFVEGRVTGEGGLSLKGAAVALVESGTGSRGFSFLQSAKDATQSEIVAGRAETGSDGRFSIRLERPGVFTLRAAADGFATHYKSGVVVDARNFRKHDISLTPGERVVGYVFDGNGRPVPEALVALYAFRGWMGASGSKEVIRTDGGGRFEFLVEPYSNQYMVRVVPPEGIDVVKMVSVPAHEDLIVRLPGTGVLRGKVVNAATQQPVPGAEVLIGIQAKAGRSWMPDYSKPVKTNEYGVFFVKNVGAGVMHSVSVRAEGFRQVSLSRWSRNDPMWEKVQATELSGDSEVELPEIALEQGRLITGTILDKETRRPVPGAEVELRDFIMGGRSTTADENGTYRFSGVGDRVSLQVRADGYAEFRDGGRRGWPVPEGDGPILRDIELESGAVLEGKVRAKDGTPLSGALVRLAAAATGRGAWQARRALRGFYTYTDKSGAYRLDGVPPVKLRVTAELQRYDEGESKPKDVKPGDVLSRIDIEMVGAARYSGTVVGRDTNKPVSGAHLTIARDPGPNADRWAQWRALSSGVSAYTDSRGRFRIDDVPTGDILIRVEADEFATLLKKRAKVEPGEKLDGRSVRLAPALSIVGKLLDPDGNPMAQAWISARHTSSPDGEPSPQQIGAMLESDGSFRLRNLPAGAYTIEVRTRGGGGRQRYRPLKRENITAGAQGLVLQLEFEEG